MPRPPTRVFLPVLALVLLGQSFRAPAAPLALQDGWQAASGQSRSVQASELVHPFSATRPPAVVEDLIGSTMALDISTASFYELVDWLRSLGLSDSGGADDLRKRLYDHYGVEAPAAEAAAGRRVTIEAAETATYSGGAADSGIVSLEGGVRLSIAENSGDTYIISARKVIYDRGRNTVYASGSVDFKRTSQGKTEEFRGSTLATDLDDWSGMFLDGVWRQQGASLSTSDRGLVFSSTTFDRISSDFITLRDVSIHPGMSDDPNFSIRASKLWFLGESDWAAFSALIYVGEVPLLWIPFFYYPSEEIFFHPVFGFRSREGTFIQTTTWLLGQKPPAPSGSSIIQFAPTTGPTTVRGIFLKHVPGGNSGGSTSSAGATAGTTSSSGSGSATTNDDSVRLLADWYTGLGAFLGFDATLKPRGILSKFDLSSGIARSRSLFPGYGVYSPYAAAGDWSSVWNSSNLFGNELQLRFGGQLSLGLSGAGITANLDLPVYSDSYFEQDFRNRSYDMDWLGLANVSTTSQSTSSVGSTTTSSISARSNLAQKLSISGNVPVALLSPWVQSFGLTLNSTYSWLAKSDQFLAAHESWDLFAYDPARQFFYPDSLRPLDLSANLGGSLFQFPPAPSSSAPFSASQGSQSDTGRPKLVAPWGDDAPADTGADAAPASSEPVFPEPPAAPDPALPVIPTPLTAKLSWTLQPGLVVERRFLSDSWTGASAIDFARLWDLYSWRIGASLNSNLALFGNDLTGSYGLSWSEQEQTRSLTDNPAYTGTTQAVSLSDAQYPRRRLTGSLRLASQPLPPDSLFAPSSVSWNLDTILYSWAFDHFGTYGVPSSAVYQEQFPEWTKDSVTANSLGLTLAVATGSTQQSLALTASLPPLTENYSAVLSLAANPWGWTFGLGGQARAVRQTSGILEPAPLTASAKVASPFGLTASDSATWDFTLQGFNANTATLAWGFASASLQSQYTQILVPVRNVGWQTTGAPAFIPASFSASLSPSFAPAKDAVLQSTFTGSLSYSQSLLRFSDSVMTVGLSLDLKLGQGFSMNLASQSQNSRAWRYWPQLFQIPSSIGSPEQFRIDPLQDIANSLAVWNPAALQAGGFKLKSLSFKLSQDLDDWTLSATAAGTPTLSTDQTYWYINPSFSVNVAWKDVPAIKSAITYQSNTLSW